ncbi:MAG: gliding motility-associated C-terminal domain-containing protein [Pedobacter sp.]
MLIFVNVRGATWKIATFEDPLIISDFTVVDASCMANGSITLKQNKGAGFILSWVDASGTSRGSLRQISNLPAGNYTLTYRVNGSDPYTLTIPVLQAYPNAASQDDLVIPCDQTFLRVRADVFSTTTISSYQWENATGRPVGSTEFINLPAGQYFLTVTDANGCSSNKARIRIKAASARPIIDRSREVVATSGCLSPDGSILGVTVTSTDPGSLTYIWRNSAGVAVSNELDLRNAPAGKYRLTARLSTGECEAVSAEIEVKQRNPLTSSTTSFVSKNADCELPNGGITGVKTNATSFRWIDVNGNTVATTLDMINVKEGYYELILSNDFGCQETLGPFHVKAGDQPIVMSSVPVIQNDSCNLSKGSILGARVIASGIRYSWTDASGKEISTNPDLRNVSSGEYVLTIRNPACSKSFSYTVQNIETQLLAPVLADKFVCSATDILISFAETAPLYRIYDQNGKLIYESTGKNFMLNVQDNMTYYGALGKGSCESPRTAFKVSVGEVAIKIPSSFTPNNDGTNDTWVLKGIEIYNTADVKIFNRYGVIVYQSTETTRSFDGKKDGNDLPSGVYYYVIKLTNECNPFTGSITLLR